MLGYYCQVVMEKDIRAKCRHHKWTREVASGNFTSYLLRHTYYVIIHQRHRQTDRQTDDMRSQYRALHKSASRGKNCYTIIMPGF